MRKVSKIYGLIAKVICLFLLLNIFLTSIAGFWINSDSLVGLTNHHISKSNDLEQTSRISIKKSENPFHDFLIFLAEKNGEEESEEEEETEKKIRVISLLTSVFNAIIYKTEVEFSFHSVLDFSIEHEPIYIRFHSLKIPSV